MSEPRIIGEVTGDNGYSGLIAMLRSWIFDLGSSFEAIDDLAGLPARYTATLLAGSSVKSLGRSSMGAILGSVGLKLIVAVDEERLRKIRHRLAPSKWPEVRQQRATAKRLALTRQPPVNSSRTQFKGDREWALAMHAKQMAATTPEFRRARARLAAKAGNEKRRRLKEADATTA
jgi:hypothetical protein